MIFKERTSDRLTDYGPAPFVIDMERASAVNTDYRIALWTGEHLQTTLMQINVGDDIGTEMHPDTDQYIMIAEGCGMVAMGKTKEQMNYRKGVQSGYGVFVPAGTWHNIVNTGNRPLKLISVYTPPEHPHGTVHATKAIAQKAEQGY